ncbi:MAG: hypothetical protein H7Y30_15140, partial [Pyrinomonadaceae bacterium]|nr:hypothetical protein [Pyrinomonadaceae bacterium]
SRNTPFDGWQLRGAAVASIVAGRVIYKHPNFNSAALRDSEATMK